MRASGLQLSVIASLVLLTACAEQPTTAPQPVAASPSALFVNSSFETGNISSWTLSTALVAQTPGVLAHPVTSETQLGLRVGGVAKTNVYTGAPYSLVPPGLSSAESARYPRFGNYAAVVNELGNSYNANRITQSSVVTTADIDPADGLVHVRFVVLPVLQNPGHSLREQPYYYVTITNTSKGTTLASRFNFSNEAGVPWQTNAAGSVVYTDWLLFDLPLARSAVSIGDTLTATVIAGGCAQSGHWGEAIVDAFGSSIPGLVVYGSGPDSVEAGSDFQYSYRVLNGGTATTTGTKLTAYLPAGTTFRSIDTAGVSCTAPVVGTRGTLLCDLGTVPAGGSLVLKVTVRADATATGAIRHGWYFSQSNLDQPLTGPLITTNVTTGGTTQYVDLSTSIDDAASSLMWGQHGAWSITVRNSGLTTATGARIVTNAPAQLTNLTWACTAPSGASCGAATGVGALDTTATIPPGKSVTWTVDADVVAGAGIGLLSFTALATAPVGAVEMFSLDNGSGDDDTLAGSMVSVAVNRAGTGGGALISVPGGVHCASGCTSTSGSFASGTQVTLQAVAVTGSVFAGWSGGTCSGTGACTFTVSSGQTITGTFDADVIMVTSPSTAKAAVGRAFSYQVTALGTAPITLDATGLPAWLTFDAQTGVLSGVAPAAGSVTVTLSATDVNGTATQPLVITSGLAPTITSALTYTVVGAGSGWTMDLEATGETPLQFNASNLPGTVYFNSTTGRFAGNAGAVGVYNVPVIATNAFGSDYKVLAVSVGGAPVITSALVGSATVGTPWTYTLTATGAATLTLGASSLPAWATFTASTGVISGTPTSAGTISIGLSAVNGVGSSNQTLVLTVDGPAVITSALTATGTAGQAFTYSLTAEGTAPLARSMTGLPAWLSFDVGSGLLSGTPPAAGTFSVTMGASNGLGSDSKTLTLTVAAPPPTPTPPLITSALVADGQVGLAFSYALTASGQVPMTFAVSGLPSWATFDAPSGVISGTPDSTGVGFIILNATNALGSDSKTLMLTIARPPLISSPLSVPAVVGDAFSYTLTANGSAPLVLSASNLPAWASFDAGSGVISGTPVADGSFTVTVGASNAVGSDSQSLVITVRTRPAITSVLTADGVVGDAFSYALTTSGTAPVTPSVGSLPAWASFDGSSGVLSGTPTVEGSISVSFGASNLAGSDTRTLVITVRARPGITSSLSAAGVVGEAFSYTLTSSGTAPVTLSAAGLPAWASFSGGVISGTPVADGTFSISLGASNAAGSDSETLVLTVRTRPAITSTLTVDGVVGVAFSYTLAATGTAPLTLSAIGLPAWASFNAASGLISGTPTADGTFTVVLGASNAAGSDAQSLVITVGTRPAITSSLSAAGVVGEAFSYTLTSSGTAPVTVSASDLPAWASFANGVISGTPVADGTFSISLSASNASGSDSGTLVLIVRTRPAITSTLTADGVVGVAFSYTLAATGTAPLTLSATGLPAWASFNASTGLISGTPTTDGTFTVALGASNAAGSELQSLVITVGTRPVITSASTASAVVGEAFSYELIVTGTAPLSLTATGLPAWASFDGTTLSGTPVADGTFTIDLGVSNGSGSDSRSLVITVRTKPAITSALAVDAVVGRPFSYALTASGTAPKILEVASLPSWASFDSSTGVISGTPDLDVDVTITLSAANAAGADSKQLVLTVRALPVVTNVLRVVGLVGEPLSVTLSATGTGPLGFAVTGLPPGLTRNGAVISGTPSEAGLFTVTETATNAAGSDTVALVFELRAIIPAPVIVGPGEGAWLASSSVGISGTAPANEGGNTIRVTEHGVLVCEAIVQVDGAWSCAAVLAEGSHSISAVIVDPRGFTGTAESTQQFTVDLTAPLVPAWAAPAAGAWLSGARPPLSGTGEAGATVTVSRNGELVCSAVVALDGSWTCIPMLPLPDGTLVLALTQHDAAGNQSPMVTRTFRLDTAAPARPTVSAPLVDALMSNGKPEITGTAEPLSTVIVSVDGEVLCTTTADAQGRYRCVPPSPLADGSHTIDVVSTDEAGNSSQHATCGFTVDTHAPGAPVISSPSGRISDSTPAIAGSAEPGSTVTVTLDDAQLCVAVADAQGHWSCAVTSPLSEGPHALAATARDATGNDSLTASGAFDVQTASGSVAVPEQTSSTDNGHLSGQASPGATVNIYVDGRLIGSTTADADGNWSFDLPLLRPGAHRVAIGITGSTGEEVFRSDDQVLTVEKPAVDFGGGIGCSSTSQAPVGVLALLAMALFSRRRRVVPAVAALVATQAFAQVAVGNFELEQLVLNPSARGGLVVGGADLLAPRDFRVAASLGYQYAPLKYFENGTLEAKLVEHRLTASVSAAASVLPWLELGATVPVVLYQGGTPATSRQGDLVMSAVPTNVSLGTPWLQGRMAVLQERNGSPVDLGLTLMLGLPLGSSASLTRESTASGQVLAGAGRTFGPVRLAAEFGAHLRVNDELVAGGDTVGSRLLMGLGASTVGGALRGEVSVRGFAPLTPQPFSAEVLVGVRYAVHDFEFFGLAGPGFGNAPGTPEFRAVLGASFGGVKSARCGGRSSGTDCPERDFDGDGVLNGEDLCPTVSAATYDGCTAKPPPVVKSEPAKVVEVVEVVVVPEPAPVQPEPEPVAAPTQVELKAGRIELRGAVYFETSKALLQARSFPLLDEVAAVLKAHPEVTRVDIEGHTDDRGSAPGNLALSEARAKAVKVYLEAAGVEAGRLGAKGYGLSKPIAPNTTAEGREKNRRVEFIVLD